jgi:hypothetical protein
MHQHLLERLEEDTAARWRWALDEPSPDWVDGGNEARMAVGEIVFLAFADALAGVSDRELAEIEPVGDGRRDFDDPRKQAIFDLLQGRLEERLIAEITEALTQEPVVVSV